MSENTGQGSSGSWRDDEVDTTQNFRDDIQRGENVGRIKVSAFSDRRECEHAAYEPVTVRAQRRQRRAAEMHRSLKPMRFVSLHHHTTFSFLDGFAMPESHVRRATEINMGALAVTEHGNIYSHVKMEKAAQEAGVKPIFGCEVYTGYTDEKRRTQRKNHLTLLAKNAVGYRNLIQLITRSWAEGFYYEPTVDPRWLIEHREGLVVLSGCTASSLTTALVGGKHVAEEDASYERGLAVARRFVKHFGENYFVEVQAFPELEKTREANVLLARVAEAIRRPLVATMDCHYTAVEESELQAVLHNTRPGERQTLEEQEQSWGYEVPLCPPPNDRSVYRRLRATGLTKEQAVEAIVSTEEIAQECTVTLPRLPRVEFPVPDGFEDVREFWRHKLKEGWHYRGIGGREDRATYREQLLHEMEIIEAKGFENYFMIVADAIVFAKENEIPVGPGRGSAAASLACYLLRITEVDPLVWPNLVFERFIDWSREDLPDIDIDFATYGRPIVRDYLVGKYGEECVNNIGTFTGYKSKNSLDDAAIVHGVPKFKVERFKDMLLERSSGDLRASATIEDTVVQFDEARKILEEFPGLAHAMDLEGNVKGFGIHAAGIVISNGPITDVTPVLRREVNGHEITAVAVDKYDAERQGLEKLDFLSLRTMDMIAEANAQLGMSVEDLYAIPFDDEETIQGFRENDVIGVFQFTGQATRSVCGALKPDDSIEVVNTNALSRPGPLHNGAAEAYIEIKGGKGKPETLHPAYDRIVESTNYQIVFQEQILRIVRDIGGFDWTHAAKIRKIIAAKKGDAAFNESWGAFVEGARTLHERSDDPPMSDETAKKIWGRCITAGSYAFNAAHATCYGIIGYWCMWLKRHHPAVFYAASLAKMPEKIDSGKLDNHASLRRDAYKRGIEILPPDPAAPTISWVAEDDETIRAGIANLKGFGEKKAEPMVEFAEATQPSGWEDYLAVTGVGGKTVETLEAFCADPDPFRLAALDDALGAAREALATGIRDGKTILPKPTHVSTEIPYESGRDLRVTYLCTPTQLHLRDIFESNRRRGEELDPAEVDRPELNEWVMMRSTDGDEMVMLRINRFKFPKYRSMIFDLQLNEDLLLVRGTKPGWRTAREIQVSDMWVLRPSEGD